MIPRVSLGPKLFVSSVIIIDIIFWRTGKMEESSC
jgi:hypothetical protein